MEPYTPLTTQDCQASGSGDTESRGVSWPSPGSREAWPSLWPHCFEITTARKVEWPSSPRLHKLPGVVTTCPHSLPGPRTVPAHGKWWDKKGSLYKPRFQISSSPHKSPPPSWTTHPLLPSDTPKWGEGQIDWPFTLWSQLPSRQLIFHPTRVCYISEHRSVPCPAHMQCANIFHEQWLFTNKHVVKKKYGTSRDNWP